MAHGGARAGDELSDTAARRVLRSLYYSLESMGNSHRPINWVSVYMCWGGHKEEEQLWVGSFHSVSLVLKVHGHLLFANFCQSQSIKSNTQVLKTYSQYRRSLYADMQFA